MRYFPLLFSVARCMSVVEAPSPYVFPCRCCPPGRKPPYPTIRCGAMIKQQDGALLKHGKLLPSNTEHGAAEWVIHGPVRQMAVSASTQHSGSPVSHMSA